MKAKLKESQEQRRRSGESIQGGQGVGQKALDLSKCPDYVVNKGHYFGTSFFKEEPPLSDDDKRALIEYLKTF